MLTPKGQRSYSLLHNWCISKFPSSIFHQLTYHVYHLAINPPYWLRADPKYDTKRSKVTYLTCTFSTSSNLPSIFHEQILDVLFCLKILQIGFKCDLKRSKVTYLTSTSGTSPSSPSMFHELILVVLLCLPTLPVRLSDDPLSCKESRVTWSWPVWYETCFLWRSSCLSGRNLNAFTLCTSTKLKSNWNRFDKIKKSFLHL